MNAGLGNRMINQVVYIVYGIENECLIERKKRAADTRSLWTASLGTVMS